MNHCLPKNNRKGPEMHVNARCECESRKLSFYWRRLTSCLLWNVRDVISLYTRLIGPGFVTLWTGIMACQMKATVLSTDRCTTSSFTFSAEHTNIPLGSMRLCQKPVGWYEISGSLEAKALPSFPGTIWVSTAEF